MKVNGTKLGMLVVFRTTDPDNGPWEPIRKDNVPKWIKDNDDVMGDLAHGMIVQNPEDDPPYAYAARMMDGFAA